MDTQSTFTTKGLHLPKSSKYPSIELDYAIGVVSDARKFGKTITDSHIAGQGSLKSGAFRRKKASLGYYGLISGRGDTFEITELASKIIAPVTPNEKTNATQEAFLNPALFRKLYESVEKNTPISIDLLGNIVVREYGIQPTGKSEFLSTFIKSGIYAGLLNYAGESRKDIVFIPKEGVDELVPLTPISNEANMPTDKLESDNQIVELVLTNGKAKIIVPKDLTPDDAKKLRAQVNLLANIYEK